MHIGQKGCNDSNLIHQVSVFLSETLKVQQLDAVLETDKQFQNIQKNLKLRLEPEAEFWKLLDELLISVQKFGGVNAQARKQMEAIVEAANRRPNTVPKVDLEDALLGLVHVISISLFNPNLGRRRTPGKGRGQRGTPDITTSQRVGSPSIIQETIPDSVSSFQRRSDCLNSDEKLADRNFENETPSPNATKLFLNIRPRLANTGGQPIYKSTSMPTLPSEKIPHHSRNLCITTIPVYTGSMDEDTLESFS